MPKFTYRARSAEDWEKRATQQGGDFKGFVKDEYRVYSPKKGENAVRMLPPTWSDDEGKPARHYGMDVFVHYSVGPDRASVLCLYRMTNKPCPICEDRASAERRNDEELVQELKPTRRTLVWMIDRKNEEQGPLIWAMPWTLDRDISKVARDRATGKFYYIDHPDEGFDVYFDREGENRNTKYTGYQLAKRPSSVDEKYLDYITTNPLPDTLLPRSYEEVKQLYEGGAPELRPSDHTPHTASSEPDDRRQHDDEPPFDVDQRKESVDEKKEQPSTVSGASRALSMRERFANDRKSGNGTATKR